MMRVLYRISDGGNVKLKPDYVHDKKRMFLHFLAIFEHKDIYVFADNVKDETFDFISNHFHDSSKLFRINLGNASSFLYTVDFAIQHFHENEKVYFAEDDYIYTKRAPEIIEEGLQIADFSSGYDHPDKYMNHYEGGNPYIENGGEITRVLITQNSHWKFTNSCCMTFATTVNILKQDYDVFKFFGVNDFELFCDLIHKRNRKLVSCIPGVSTHGETNWLSPFVDWKFEFQNSLSP